MNVGLDRLKLRIVVVKQLATAAWPPRRNSNREVLLAGMPHDPAA